MTTDNKHKVKFKFALSTNSYLRLADAFLEANPEVLFWTEPNDSKRGLFYEYKDGYYRPVSTFVIENRLLDFSPKEADIPEPKRITRARLLETMHNITRMRFFYHESFNPEGIVNFKNGFFLMEKGELIPHTMDIISTNQLPYNYDPKVKCPLFMKALNDAVDGDTAKVSVLQEYAGYCLTRETKYDRALFLIGAAGSGKSTILNGFEAMLGRENVSNISMEQLCKPKFAGNFIGKLANIDREIPHDIRNYEEVLKKIISGEEITVDTKFVPSYNAKPYCKIIFAANDMPRILDSSNGIFRRLIFIDFNNVVKKVDYNLRDKVKKEGAGIFNWAFDGLQRLESRGEFLLSKKLIENVEELRLQNNAVYYYITENFDINLSEDMYITVDAMYDKYLKFCHNIEAKGIFKKPIFGKEIKKIFPKEIGQKQCYINGQNCRIWTKLAEKSIMTGAWD